MPTLLISETRGQQIRDDQGVMEWQRLHELHQVALGPSSLHCLICSKLKPHCGYQNWVLCNLPILTSSCNAFKQFLPKLVFFCPISSCTVCPLEITTLMTETYCKTHLFFQKATLMNYYQKGKFVYFSS